MKNKLSLIIAMFTIALSTTAQDLITKKNGEDIKAKVIEIGLNEVKFKRFDNLDGPLIIIAKSEVLIIRYENGGKEIFEESNLSIVKLEMPKDMNWNRQAEIDAQKYYRGYRRHYVGTFIPCIIIGPLFGLIPAVGNFHAKVRENDMLNNKNPEWLKNKEYNDSYTEYAKKMKRKRVLGGYLGGSLIFVGIAGILAGTLVN